MNAEIQHRTTLATELRQAQERGEFVVCHQPIARPAHEIQEMLDVGVLPGYSL